MPYNSGSGTTQRPDLASCFNEFPIEGGERGFIGMRVLPLIDVAKQAGTFGRIPVEQLLKQRNLARAPKSGYSRSDWSFVDETFACKEYGAEEPVDDREAAMYQLYFQAELESTQIAISSVLTAAEKRVAEAVFDTSVWTGSDLTTAVTNAWDSHASATPIDDVADAVKAVWDASGLHANALVITNQAFRHLRQCSQIQDAITSSGAGGSILTRDITTRQLAQAFGLDHVSVAGGTENSASEGQDASFSEIWDSKKAMVCRVADGQSFREPCLGRTFHWTDDGGTGRRFDGDSGTSPIVVETYREDAVRGDVVRVRHDVDEKILYKEAGHLLTSVLSS